MFALVFLSFRLMFKAMWWAMVLMVYIFVFGFAVMWAMMYGFIALCTWGRSTRTWKLRQRSVLGLPMWL